MCSVRECECSEMFILDLLLKRTFKLSFKIVFNISLVHLLDGFFSIQTDEVVKIFVFIYR